jgi:hypothetical protein
MKPKHDHPTNPHCPDYEDGICSTWGKPCKHIEKCEEKKDTK